MKDYLDIKENDIKKTVVKTDNVEKGEIINTKDDIVDEGKKLIVF